MTSQELRQKYLQFFKERGHAIIPSASLVPENDPTVLFTTAGMHPLVPYLLGQIHPGGRRLASVQKSLRTDDIAEVGDATHHTFFEMLGNWSLGDYWKKEAISWSWEFLTDQKGLALNPARLAVTVFAGDADAPRDEESVEIWKSLGVPSARIAYLGKKDNWWGPAGLTGPCGPDTEMFYWSVEEKPPALFDPKDKRWVEIWNDVFMQYDKTIDGKFEPLPQRNVDTGMGLERTLAVLSGFSSVYDTDVFQPIVRKIREMAVIAPPEENGEREKAERIIADHLRAAVFVIADGVVPSNKDRGYILRRLIRRAVRYGQMLGIQDEFCAEVGGVVIRTFEGVYPELRRHAEKIADELGREDLKFRKTLSKGLREFEKLKHVDGRAAFDLFQTYGFPWELTRELAENRGWKLDAKEFEAEFHKHQELSRTHSAGVFKGGLADHSEKTTRLHTATHLLQAGLRHVLGAHVFQKGSHVTAERTRFDFNHPQKVTADDIERVEAWVNQQITRDLPVKREIMTVPEARALGAIGLFDDKYQEKVSVYTIFDPQTGKAVSREFCGGPHVMSTGQIGQFKIVKEEAVAGGVRRIKATVS